MKVPALAGLPLRIQQEKSARGFCAEENHGARAGMCGRAAWFRSIFPVEFRQTRSDGDSFASFLLKKRRMAIAVRRTTSEGNENFLTAKEYPEQ
jgi:hypothetical protein